MEWVILTGILVLAGMNVAGIIADSHGISKEFYAKIQELLEGKRLKLRKSDLSGIPGLRFFRISNSLKGTIGGKHFSITGFKGGADRLAIRLNHRVPNIHVLCISKETTLFRIEKKMKGEDILTGDAQFDSAMKIGGDDPVAVRSLLNNGVRKNVLELFKSSMDFVVTGDRIGMVIDGVISEKLAVKAVDLLCTMLEVSDSMTAPGSVAARLMSMLEMDNEPEVKILCLRDLSQMKYDNGLIRAAITRALDDHHPAVRYEAARCLGAEGIDRMMSFLKIRSFPDELKCETLDALAEAGRTISVPVLKRLFDESGAPELRIRIIDTMMKAGDALPRDFIEKCLYFREKDVVLRAIQALGDCGTVESVEKLCVLEKSSRNAETRSAARESIARIQSRLEPGDRGWLSVSELREGECMLSTPPAVEGALSEGEDVRKKSRGKRRRVEHGRLSR